MKRSILPRLTFPLLALVLLAGPVHAHEPTKGPNGGMTVDAGAYHVELVARAAKVDVFVTDSGNQPVPAAGFRGTAILVVDGKAQRIVLSPADGNRLTGTASAPLPANPKGAVQLSLPDGKTAQGKFN